MGGPFIRPDADRVGILKIPRVKLAIGAAGVDNGNVSSSNPLPVTMPAGAGVGINAPVQSYAPGYEPNPGGTASPTVDEMGYTQIRGTVMTDEGGSRTNFANATLALSIGDCTFTNGSDQVTTSGHFTDLPVHLGDYIYLNADGATAAKRIDAIDDQTIWLSGNYAGAGGTGASSAQTVLSKVGTGGAFAISGGQATLGSGTTNDSVQEIERDVDILPLTATAGFSISQRIANQSIYFGFYDEDGPGGVARWYFWFDFNGIVNTNVNCVCAWNPSAAPTGGEISTTTVKLPDGITTATSNRWRIEALKDRVVFWCNDIAIHTEYRCVPHPSDFLTLTLRVANGTGAAGNTNVVCDYFGVSNYNVVTNEYASNTTQAQAPCVPSVDYSYNVAGAITINTDLLFIDCRQIRSLQIQCISMGTSGVVTPSFSNDDGTTFVGGQLILSAGGAIATTFNGAGLWTVPVAGRICRLRLTTGASGGTTTLRVAGLQQPAAIAPTTVTVTASNLSCNVAQWSGQTPLNPVANGSTNRVIVAAQASAVANVDQNATAYAGSGRVNGTVVAAAAGGGGACIAAEFVATVTTLGTATLLVPVLQESTSSASFTDIWVGDAFSVTTTVRVPPMPVGGRRRWCLHSVGGTSTTVPCTVNTLELPAGYVCNRQYRDYYSATNPFASVINNTAQAATTLVSTGASCMTATSQITSPCVMENCKVVTMKVVMGNGPTVTQQPVLTLQFSDNLTDWWSSTATITGAGNGVYAATASNICFRYARIAVTTAATYSLGNYTLTFVGINGVN